MSYSIEYAREVYKEPAEKGGDANYLLLIKQGDNNCYDASGLRARHWNFVDWGWEYSLWYHIGERGGACEGGSLQRANGWKDTKWIKIEDYIALYRKAIRLARPLDEVFDSFDIRYEVEVCGTKKTYPVLDMKEWNCQKITEYLNKRGLELKQGQNWIGDKILEATAPIQTKAELLEAIKYQVRYGETRGLTAQIYFCQRGKWAIQQAKRVRKETDAQLGKTATDTQALTIALGA